MTIKNYNDDIILVDLPNGHHIAKELNDVNHIVSEKPGRDIIIDFINVDMLTSANLSNLMILHNLLKEQGRKLILCNVSFLTKCIFTVAGLDVIFNFTEGQNAALQAVQN